VRAAGGRWPLGYTAARVDIALDFVFVIVGIAVLYWGAEWLIRGSAAIARSFGVKPLVIGLTVVAYGASAPELAVATKTALTHHPAIALGTVIGSCAANISLILGLTALISPPTVDSRIIKREVPVLVGSAVAVPLLLWNGTLSRFEGLILIGCAVVFTILTLTVSARLEPDGPDPHESGAAMGGRGRPRRSPFTAGLITTIGLFLLVGGSDLFVRGARDIATHAGMSERMLGLTVISLGCALPELIGSLVAAARGQSALAVGSVIGSNLLNVFLVLGVTAYLEPIELQPMHAVELVGLVVITLLGVLTLRGSRKITRFEGILLVAAYVAFVVTSGLL